MKFKIYLSFEICTACIPIGIVSYFSHRYIFPYTRIQSRTELRAILGRNCFINYELRDSARSSTSSQHSCCLWNGFPKLSFTATAFNSTVLTTSIYTFLFVTQQESHLLKSEYYNEIVNWKSPSKCVYSIRIRRDTLFSLVAVD